MLATDEGFLHDASGGGEAVWERLDEPTGNVEYVDGWFRPLAPLVEPPQQQPQRRWGLVAAAGGASRRPPPASVSPPSLTSALPPPTATTPAPAPSSVAAAAAAAAAPAAMSAVDATAAVPPFPPPAHRSPGVSDRLLALQLERDQEEAAREGKRAFAAEGVAALLGEGGPLELLRARDPGAVVPLPCASPSPPVGDREVAAAGRMGEDGQGEEVEGGFYLVSAAAAGNGGGGGGGGIGGVGEEAFFVDPETRRPFTGEELAAMRAAEEAFRCVGVQELRRFGGVCVYFGVCGSCLDALMLVYISMMWTGGRRRRGTGAGPRSDMPPLTRWPVGRSLNEGVCWSSRRSSRRDCVVTTGGGGEGTAVVVGTRRRALCSSRCDLSRAWLYIDRYRRLKKIRSVDRPDGYELLALAYYYVITFFS